MWGSRARSYRGLRTAAAALNSTSSSATANARSTGRSPSPCAPLRRRRRRARAPRGIASTVSASARARRSRPAGARCGWPRRQVEIARRLSEVRDRVQPPVRLDELAKRHVVGDRGLPKLLTAAPIGLEFLSVPLAVERAAPRAAPPSRQRSSQLPFGLRCRSLRQPLSSSLAAPPRRLPLSLRSATTALAESASCANLD